MHLAFSEMSVVTDDSSVVAIVWPTEEQVLSGPYFK